MRSRRPPTRAAIVATLLVSSRVGAQQGEISISGGTATDQRGVRSNALTLAPSVLLTPTNSTALSLGASVTRFGGAAQSLGGAGVFSARNPITRAVSLAMDLSGAGSHFSGDGASASFASGDIVPTLELGLRVFTLFGGGRVATGYASRSIARQPLPLFGGDPSESRTTNGAGPLFGATFRTTTPSGTALRLSARDDLLRVSGVTISDQALSASIATDVAAISGTLGRRVAPDEHTGFGNVSISLPLSGDVSLQGGAGRYASNRLTGTPGGDYLDAGVAVRFGRSRPRAARASPSVFGAPRVARGFTRLAIDAPDAERVDVAGDFNEWMPVPARRAEHGVWYVDLRIPAGQYRYAFRVNAREWRVPRGATAVNDGFGGKSAWLIVAETGQ